MARSPGSHAGPSYPKECAVWLAISTSSTGRIPQRWRDVAKANLQQIDVKDEWYKIATTLRSKWKSRCRQGVKRHRESGSSSRLVQV